jgi:hypothetical protein
MQMLGIGGAGALGATSVPLFGSSDTPGLDSPDFAGHHVVRAKPLTQNMHEPKGHAVVVKRLTPMRSPGKEVIVYGRRGGLLTNSVPYDGSIKDAHRAYYLGAHEMRDKFSAQSTNFLKDFSESHSQFLFTVVHSEIQVYDSAVEGHLTLGFDFEQYVVAKRNRFTIFDEDYQKESDDFLRSFESYSKSGKYPISVPRDIDFGVLLKLDAEVVSSRAPKDRVSRILGSLWG